MQFIEASGVGFNLSDTYMAIITASSFLRCY